MADRPWLYVFDGKLKGIGIDQVAEQQLRALSEAGSTCELLARGRLDLPGIGNSTCRFPASKLLSWLPSQDYYAANKRFFSWLGERRFRAERHCGVIAWSKTALRPFEAAARAGLPRILNVGNFHCDFEAGGKIPPTRWPRIGKERLRREYELATRILVASDYAAETFVAHGIPRAKLGVIYRGVDTTRFLPAETATDRPFIVASCGLLGERKGTYQLLEAWKSLNLPDAELWLIGHAGADELQQLQARATPSVRFLGFRRDLPKLMQQVHIHVLLSRNEGFAKVLLEAAACGAVNVCTKATGWPNGARGARIVGDRTDVGEVAAAIAELYANGDLRRQLGEQARRTVCEQLTWAHFRQRFHSELARALHHDPMTGAGSPLFE